jgi:hypothetical protein
MQRTQVFYTDVSRNKRIQSSIGLLSMLDVIYNLFSKHVNGRLWMTW